MLEDLESPASILITVAAHSVTAISTAGLDVTIRLLFKTVSLHPLMAGVSVAEVIMSLNVARERLRLFGVNVGFALRRGVGVPSGGIGEIDTLPFWGVFSREDLICVRLFFLSSLRLTLNHSGCEEPLSTSLDDPSTFHQFPGGRLLRFSRSSCPGCSWDFSGLAAVGVLDLPFLVPCWYT